MNEQEPVFVHEKALVETRRIGPGTRIWAFAHVMADVRIGSDCNIGEHAFIESPGEIGNNVTIKNGVCVWRHVHVADDVFLGPNVVLTNERYPRSRVPAPLDEPWTEEVVTVGANATVLPGLRLGRRCFVGAGAVVTRDVPPYALVAGNPARQRGWACHCAHPLEPIEAGEATCKRCGRGWIVSADALTPASGG